MRRRQHEGPQKMTEPSTDPIDQEDPDGRYFGAEKFEDSRPLLAVFGISSHPHHDNEKAFSVMPRNYNTRRRLLIVVGCFILSLVVFQGSKRKGKTIEKSSFILVVVCFDVFWEACSLGFMDASDVFSFSFRTFWSLGAFHFSPLRNTI